MTVKELIKILKSWPNKDSKVLLSTDAEGNHYRSICDVVECIADKHGDVLGPASDEDEPGNRVLVVYPN